MDDLILIETSIPTSNMAHHEQKKVLNPVKPGVARFNYCNFWYVPWDTLCTAPAGAFFMGKGRQPGCTVSMAVLFCRSCEAWRPQL